MNIFLVDIESDNSSPANGSMVCFGAVKYKSDQTFYGETSPIITTYNPEALKISGFTREEHEKFPDPRETMKEFQEWVYQNSSNNRATLISDNNSFDMMWITYYFDLYNLDNPFGFSSRRLGDLYCGIQKNFHVNREWKKKYRKTKHTHNPVDDAQGNAEALEAFEKLGLKI